jgi:hypothetical protein
LELGRRFGNARYRLPNLRLFRRSTRGVPSLERSEMDTLPEFSETGECERCKREAVVSKTGICERCLREILELRDGKHAMERQKRLRALNAAEKGILRNVRARMLLDTHQATPHHGLSFPKILKERDTTKARSIHAKAAAQELLRHARDASAGAEVLVQAVVEAYDTVSEGELAARLSRHGAQSWKRFGAIGARHIRSRHERGKN